MKIEKVRSNLAKAEREYRAWLAAVQVYEECSGEPIGDYPESVFKAYIITGTVTDAARMLNDAGQRINGKRFGPNDVSATITNEQIEDTELMLVARFLLSNGRSFINNLYN